MSMSKKLREKYNEVIYPMVIKLPKNVLDHYYDLAIEHATQSTQALREEVEELNKKLNGQEKAHQLELKIMGENFQAKCCTVANLADEVDELKTDLRKREEQIQEQANINKDFRDRILKENQEYQASITASEATIAKMNESGERLASLCVNLQDDKNKLILALNSIINDDRWLEMNIDTINELLSK